MSLWQTSECLIFCNRGEKPVVVLSSFVLPYLLHHGTLHIEEKSCMQLSSNNFLTKDHDPKLSNTNFCTQVHFYVWNILCHFSPLKQGDDFMRPILSTVYFLTTNLATI